MDRKKVLVTGAASGIGRAVTARFAREGFDICVNDLQTGKLEALIGELPKGDHLLLAGSYAENATIAEGERLIAKHWGAVDVLVNCAGIFVKSDPLDPDLHRWRSTFDIMLNGCMMTTKLAVKFMQQEGRIVHISSIHGDRAEKYASGYSMAKAAINQYCRSVALELGERNILVNAIAPGFVNTAMSVVDGENELESQWFRDNYILSHHLPLRRAAEPEEIAGVAFFLGGKDASYITGQVITVDGGLTITF